MLNKKTSALLIIFLALFSFLVHQSLYDILNIFTKSFSIKEINVSGAMYSKNAEFDQIITSSTNLTRGNLSLLNITTLKNQLETLVLIKNVDINKDLPHTLTIKITERTPIAFIKIKNQSYQVDNDGVILYSLTNSLPLALPTIDVEFGVALNNNQVVDEHIIKTLSTLHNTNIILIDKIRIDKNRETYFTLKNTKPQFYIEKLPLSENFIFKAQGIANTLNTTNLQKTPKIIDIYSNKDTSIGFF